MTLRTRLFLLVGGLAVVLVLAQWLLVRSLARDVTSEVGHVAFRVGEGVVASLGMLGGPDAAPGDRELPRAGAPGRTVTEREIRLRAGGDRLEVVSENVRVSHVAQAGAIGAQPLATEVIPAEDARAFVMLSVHGADHARFLRLGSPRAERQAPIPQAGVEDALASFRKRLLAGSAILLGAGLALAALIAHRATAPLRELSAAARAVGAGALGTQVPQDVSGEAGEAVAAFNTMSRRLAELDAESRRLHEREHLTEVGVVIGGKGAGLPAHFENLKSVQDLDPVIKEQVLAALKEIFEAPGGFGYSFTTGIAPGEAGAVPPGSRVRVRRVIEDAQARDGKMQ